MVGAVTTLIVIVAVFLAYNANSGLPFVPVYRVSVEIPERRAPDAPTTRSGSAATGSAWSSRSTRSSRRGDRDGAGERRERGRRPDRRRGRAAQPEARQDRPAAAEGLGLPGPLPLLVRAQVPGDHPRRRASRRPRASSSTASTTSADSASACPLPGDPQFASADERPERLLPGADRVRRHQQHLRHADAANARATTSMGFGNAFAGRGTSLNDAIDSLEPLFRGLRAGRPRSLTEPDTACAASSPSSATRRGSSPRSPSEQAELVHQRARSPSPRSPPTRRRSRRRSPRACRRSRRGSSCCPRQRPFLRDFATLEPRAAPGRHGPAHHAAGPQRRDRGRHAGAAAIAADQPQARGRAALSSTGSSPSRPPRSRCSGSRRPSTPRSRSRSGSPRRRPSATTATTGSPTSPNGLSDRDQVGYAFRQMLTDIPGSFEAEAASRRRTPALQSNGRSGRPTGGSFKPYEIPILNAHAVPADRPAQRRLPGRPDRLRARPGPAPRPGRRQPGLRRLRPARLARADDAVLPTPTGDRELRDTRIPSRQPETWGRGRMRKHDSRRLPSWADRPRSW